MFADQVLRKGFGSGGIVGEYIGDSGDGAAMADNGNACFLSAFHDVLGKSGKIDKIGNYDNAVKLGKIGELEDVKLSVPAVFSLSVCTVVHKEIHIGVVIIQLIPHSFHKVEKNVGSPSCSKDGYLFSCHNSTPPSLSNLPNILYQKPLITGSIYLYIIGILRIKTIPIIKLYKYDFSLFRNMPSRL